MEPASWSPSLRDEELPPPTPFDEGDDTYDDDTDYEEDHSDDEHASDNSDDNSDNDHGNDNGEEEHHCNCEDEHEVTIVEI